MEIVAHDGAVALVEAQDAVAVGPVLLLLLLAHGAGRSRRLNLEPLAEATASHPRLPCSTATQRLHIHIGVLENILKDESWVTSLATTLFTHHALEVKITDTHRDT